MKMKKSLQIIILLLISNYSFGQMIMTAEGISPENACNPNAVYFLIENRARPIASKDSIEVKLNNYVKFAKENPTFTGKPSIQFVVNCRGENGGGFHVVTKSGDDNFDQELISFFKTVKEWQAGKIRKKTVDSWYMWRLEVNNGYIKIL